MYAKLDENKKVIEFTLSPPIDEATGEEQEGWVKITQTQYEEYVSTPAPDPFTI